MGRGGIKCHMSVALVQLDRVLPRQALQLCLL